MRDSPMRGVVISSEKKNENPNLTINDVFVRFRQTENLNESFFFFSKTRLDAIFGRLRKSSNFEKKFG